MTSTPDIATATAPAPFELPKLNVVDQVDRLANLQGDQVIDFAVSYGPGLAIALIAFFSLMILRRLMIKFLTHSTDVKKLAGWRHWVLPFVLKISPAFLFMVSLAIAANFLPFPPALDGPINTALGVIILIQLGLIATTVLHVRTQHMMEHRADRNYDSTQVTMFSTLSMIGQLGVWVVVLLLCLENIGVNVTTLIAGVGIGGIAIAFAFKSILEDVFASLSIAFDKPFVIGDFIESGAHKGTIEKIGMKNIRMRSLTGEQIIINNNDLLSTRISNYGRMRERRVNFTLRLDYDTAPEKLQQVPTLIRSAIEAQPNTRFDRSHFQQFGEYSLVFETVYYMTTPDYNQMMDNQQAINLTIMQKFRERGISFATVPRAVALQNDLEKAA